MPATPILLAGAAGILATYCGYYSFIHRRRIRRNSKWCKCVVITIDIGTSGIRCKPFFCHPEADKNITKLEPIEEATVKISGRLLNDDGYADACVVFDKCTEALTTCVKALRSSEPHCSVRAVGIACFAMSLVGVSEKKSLSEI
jgi:sugar (pentulose or hexulose) kinase